MRIAELQHQIERVYSQYFADFPLFTTSHGEITGRFFKLKLASRFRPIVSLQHHHLHGHQARLKVIGPDRQSLSPTRLFQLASNSSALITLDRMVRTLHVLNYLELDRDQQNTLFLPVETALLGAVKEGHGRFFEHLLGQLGRKKQRIVIALSQSALLDPEQFHTAVTSYHEHGFGVSVRLDATFPAPLDTLRAAAPDCVIVDINTAAPADGNLRQLAGIGLPLICANRQPGFDATAARDSGFLYQLA